MGLGAGTITEETGDGATPLTWEELQGLIPSYITLRRELNEAEQRGILEADSWAFSRKRDVLSEKFLLSLHRRMFRQIWRWAGKIRTTERNIGVPAWRIAVDLRQLLGDVSYWIDHATYSADEIAARFHHKLVFIHPFPNGNGRHARLAADLLAVRLDRERFSWGRFDLQTAEGVRRVYIDALRAADRHNLAALLTFVRT